LDLAAVGKHDPAEFFREVIQAKDNLRIRPGDFLILFDKEFVRVPPELACEMRTMDDRSGEFRAHFAGFIDPGWGWGLGGEGLGRPLTLEVKAHEQLMISSGQPIAKIGFDVWPACRKFHTTQVTHKK